MDGSTLLMKLFLKVSWSKRSNFTEFIILVVTVLLWSHVCRLGEAQDCKNHPGYRLGSGKRFQSIVDVF